jgi:hypothetical protein
LGSEIDPEAIEDITCSNPLLATELSSKRAKNFKDPSKFRYTHHASVKLYLLFIHIHF